MHALIAVGHTKWYPNNGRQHGCTHITHMDMQILEGSTLRRRRDARTHASVNVCVGGHTPRLEITTMMVSRSISCVGSMCICVRRFGHVFRCTDVGTSYTQYTEKMFLESLKTREFRHIDAVHINKNKKRIAVCAGLHRYWQISHARTCFSTQTRSHPTVYSDVQHHLVLSWWGKLQGSWFLYATFTI